MPSPEGSYYDHERRAQELLQKVAELQGQHGVSGQEGASSSGSFTPASGFASPHGSAVPSFVRRTGTVSITPRSLAQGNSLLVSAYEGNLRPEEEGFHDVLEDFMDAHENMRKHKRADDDNDLTHRANMYQRCILELEEDKDMGADSLHGTLNASTALGVGNSAPGGIFTSLRSRGSVAAVADADLKLEVDLWKLLSMLTECGLMRRSVDEKVSPGEAVLSLDPIKAEPDEPLKRVLERALEERWALRKGEVLQIWLEDCARRGVDFSEVSETMKPIKVRNPDAQLRLAPGSGGGLIPLDGRDGADQERLLLAVWKLVRCGEIEHACQLAFAEGYSWLASAIRGVVDVGYSLDGMEVEGGEEAASSSSFGEHFGAGNSRRPMWLSSVFKYAKRLEEAGAGATHAKDEGGGNGRGGGSRRGLGNVGRRGTGAGRLEMAVFGALSDNTSALEASGQLGSWSDRIWMRVKVSHDLDMAHQAAAHRRERAACSALYPGCDASTIDREREWMEGVASTCPPVDLWSCKSLFQQEPPPGTTVDGPVEGAADGVLARQNILLLDPPPHVISESELWRVLEACRGEWILQALQAAVMGGGALLGTHLRASHFHVVRPLCSALLAGHPAHAPCFFPGHARVLRVYAHFALWLASADTTCPALAALLDAQGELLAGFVGAYAHHLLRRGQGTLVPTYCAALWSHERRGSTAALGRGPLAAMSLDVAVSLVVGHTMDAAEGAQQTDQALLAREEAAQDVSTALRTMLPPHVVLEVLVRAVRALLYGIPPPGLMQDERRGTDTQTTRPEQWRLRALSWLCRPDEQHHWADAMREANAFLFHAASMEATSLAVEQPGSGVAMLCSLPSSSSGRSSSSTSDSEGEAKCSFMSELQCVVDECLPTDVLHVAERFAGPDPSAESALALWSETRRWRLWQALARARSAVCAWHAALVRHESLLEELQGGNSVVRMQMQRVVPALDQAAHAARDALSAVLSLDENATPPAGATALQGESGAGVAGVLNAAEELLVLRCARALGGGADGAAHGLDTSMMGTDLTEQHSFDADADVASPSLRDEVLSVLRNTCAGALERKPQLSEHLEAVSRSSSTPCSAIALRRCREALHELARDQAVMRSVVAVTVRAMCDVTLHTASALRLVDADACADWYKRCALMASLVASDNPETLLYVYLSQAALKSVLTDVGAASLEILDMYEGTETTDASFDMRIAAN